jgi:RNA ligase
MKTLIMLMGPQGSGKTTYYKKNLKGALRVSQDDQGRNEHMKVFEDALRNGEQTVVVDRMNFDRQQRSRYLNPAKKAGYSTKIVWLNEDKAICIKRCQERRGHPTLKPEDAESAVNWYFSRMQPPSRTEADELEVIGMPPHYVHVKDIREEIGDRRYIVIGDIHGCVDEFEEMLFDLEFNENEDVLISVGDLIDRGPSSKGVTDYVMSLPNFYMVKGNHEEKFLRYAKGNQVKIAHGLQGTIDELGEDGVQKFADFVRDMPLILRVPDGYVVHAGFNPLAMPDEQNKADCIYMRYFGGDGYFDKDGGILWFKLWDEDKPRAFFGHNPDPAGPCYHNIYHLDGGCVFGGVLKAWDSKTGNVHYVAAKEEYSTSAYGLPGADNDIPEISERERLVVANMLRTDRTDDDALAVYTYTDPCVFERAWDDVTINSRGHVFDTKTGECVAWPFPKFFNLNERPNTQFNELPWDKPYEVFEKMDGWLGTLYRHDGKFKVASRGSFHSPGAEWATEFIQTKNLSSLPDNVTLVFEMIAPGTKIILDYSGDSNLYILAAFDRHTGDEFPRAKVEEWGKAVGLPVVEKYDSMTVEDCMEIAKKVEGTEGFVIRFEDGTRVKIKTEWYSHLAKVMMNLSPIAMWEKMEGGKIPGSFIRELPDELRPMAERYRDRLEDQYAQAKKGALKATTAVVKKFAAGDPKDHEVRKSLGLALKNESRVARRMAFMLLDGRDSQIDEAIKEMIYPKSNEWVDVEDALKGSLAE